MPISQGPSTSKIVYVLFYDQETLSTPEEKTKNREERIKRFSEGLENMKAMSEAN